jgi:hypothetical protein
MYNHTATMSIIYSTIYDIYVPRGRYNIIHKYIHISTHSSHLNNVQSMYVYTYIYTHARHINVYMLIYVNKQCVGSFCLVILYLGAEEEGGLRLVEHLQQLFVVVCVEVTFYSVGILRIYTRILYIYIYIHIHTHLYIHIHHIITGRWCRKRARREASKVLVFKDTRTHARARPTTWLTRPEARTVSVLLFFCG